MTRSPLTGGRRLLRAGVLGSTSMLLATGAHLAGGGRLPSPLLLAVAGALVGLVAVTLTRRRVRLRTLAPVLVAEQLLLHLVLGLATAAATCAPMAGHAGHVATACTPGAGPTEMGMMPGWSMWAAHLTAAAATAWLLARAETALWSWAERVTAAATAAPGLRPRTGRAPRPAYGSEILPVRLAGLVAARAPPAAAYAA